MQQNIARFSILHLVMLVCFAQASYAQSSGFPAFSPEPEEESVAEPARSAKFPTAEALATPETMETAPQRNNLFPVEKVSFPTQTEAQPVSQVGTSLTQETLGTLLTQELSLEASPFGNRHDFLYRADLENQELELFFSVSLSEDASQLRVRAWLDPLPQTVISEEPLLKLLNRNIEMKAGLHYGYSQEARRLLLETVLVNKQITPEVMKTALQDVSQEVAGSWALWTTSEWTTTAPKKIAVKPELDSRNNAHSSDQFEMPIRR